MVHASWLASAFLSSSELFSAARQHDSGCAERAVCLTICLHHVMLLQPWRSGPDPYLGAWQLQRCQGRVQAS